MTQQLTGNVSSGSTDWRWAPVRLGLQQKFVLLISVLLILAVATSTAINTRTQEEVTRRRMEDRAHSMVGLLGRVVINPLALLHVTQIKIALQDVVEEPEVLYAYVYDQDGLIVMDAAKDKRPYVGTTDQAGIPETTTMRVMLLPAGALVMEVTEPLILGDTVLGGLRLGFSLARMEGEINGLRTRNLLVGLAATLFGVVATVVLVRTVTRPLGSLIEGTLAVARGEFGKKVEVRSGDEVELLSRSFNQMTDNLQALTSRLQYMAGHDPLTGLVNRRRFNEELERSLAQARRYGYSGAMVFVDLDNFKFVNDRLGHGAGDELLVRTAKLLRDQVREADLVARLGGDEFAVLLPNCDPSHVAPVVDRILAAMREHSTLVDGEQVHTTCSVGVALYPDHGETGAQLLSRADLAMYRAKAAGRNGYRVYSPEMSAQFTWEGSIRSALQYERFVLYSQPIRPLQHGDTHYEVLLRMQGEDGEIILPSEFLPIAEQSGQIHAVDRWVVRQTIRLLAGLQRAGRDVCLEVNLSGKAFQDEQLLPFVEQELRARQVNPARLVFEVTETAAVTDFEKAREFIGAMKALGCRFAIDDFGVGFSSFYYLKHLPVDYLKIDGEFVRHLASSALDQHLVRSMVDVARGLGKQTVAEWVGDAETVRLLREYGVDYVQGYHLGRPCAVADEFGPVATDLSDEQPEPAEAVGVSA